MLLDEPFTGVDVKTEKTMIELLIELRSWAHTILISTHDLASVATFCDQVVLINRTILAYGPTSRSIHRRKSHCTFSGGRLSDLP